MPESVPVQWREDDLVLDDVRLRYRRGGSGSAVLLLHGLTDAGSSWRAVAVALARSHDVAVPDQRGHGSSSAPETGYAIDDFVRDAAQLITALNYAPAAVVGHSLGGLVGLYLAATHPFLVSRLVLEDPPLLADWLTETGSPDEIDAARRAWFASALEVRDMTPEEQLQHVRERSPQWNAEEYAAWVESKLSMSDRLWTPGGIDLRGDWQTALRRIHCPILLIRGDAARGSLINESREQDVLSLARQARAVHVAGASHAVHRDMFAEFMSTLIPFLAEDPTARKGSIARPSAPRGNSQR